MRVFISGILKVGGDNFSVNLLNLRIVLGLQGSFFGTVLRGQKFTLVRIPVFSKRFTYRKLRIGITLWMISVFEE